MGVAEVLQELNKGRNRAVATVGLKDEIITRIPFSSPRLNYMTYGGVPRGRISMFVGRESSGKTTIALDIVKQAQRLFRQEWEAEINELQSMKKLTKEKSERLAFLEENGPRKIYYFDAENTLDTEWAATCGVDIFSEDLIHVKLLNETAEEYLTKVNIAASRGAESTGLIIVDSIAALVSEQIFGESLENKKMGGTASINVQWLRMFNQYLADYGITCVIINQVISDLKNLYADFKIPGGNGVMHYSSVILVTKKGNFIAEDGTELTGAQKGAPYGNAVNVQVQKTKAFKPDRRTGDCYISYSCGVDSVLDTVDMLADFECVNKAGSWYTLLDPETTQECTTSDGKPVKFQGAGQLVNYLRENPEVLKLYTDYIQEISKPKKIVKGDR